MRRISWPSSHQRHPRPPAADAGPALWAGGADLLDRRYRRRGRLPHRARSLEVWCRAVSCGPGQRGGRVRHPHQGGRAPGSSVPNWLSPDSTKFAQPSIEDYAERTTAMVAAWQGMHGKQGSDPRQARRRPCQSSWRWTCRRCASPRASGAVGVFETKARTLLAQAAAHRGLSSSLAHDDA